MPDRPEVTDLTDLAEGWTAQADDLRASVVILRADQSLAGHVNWETDVVLLGVAGGGEIVLDGEAQDLVPMSLVIVARGVRRELRAGPGGPFRVLVVHRRTAVSGSWRWKPRRRRPWEDDPWEDDPWEGEPDA